jgi:heme/copper-type cytochrome/quinol oxidase subunit 1
VSATLTESAAPPEQETAAAPDGGGAAPAGVPSTFGGVLGSADHKVIGRLFITVSLLMGVVATVMGALAGYERIDTSTSYLENAAQQIFTLHSIGAVFLFLLPLVLGVAIVIVPLQVGAATIAFPRAAAGSFWLWLVSGGVLLGAYAINGGPFGGDGEGVDLFLVAFGGVIVALLLATICVVSTVVGLRPPGMTLDRAPLFSWSMLVAGAMWLLSLPVLLATTVLLYVDHRNGRVLFGGTEGIYARIVWVFAQPQLYAFAVPALGFALDVVPVFSRARARHRGVQLSLVALVGMLGFGAWTQAVFTADGKQVNAKLDAQTLYIVMAVLVVIPLLGILGAAFDSLRRGQVRVAAPLVFGIGALLLVLAGAVAGAISTIRDLDLLSPPTTWTTGQAHLVLLGVALATVGAAHYWAPKLYGRMLRGGVAMFTAVLFFVGALLLAIPDLVSGLRDQPTMLVSSDVRDGVEALNAVSLAGGAVVALAVLLFVLNLLLSLGRTPEEDLPDNPWDGHTLEWATASPPRPGNFAVQPEVRSAEPLLDDAPAGGEE